MSELNKELIELRREVVEARNQAIKTDNQVKNIGLDVKGFEQRFDALERRTRLASVGAHLIVALAVAGAAFVVGSIRTSGYSKEIQGLQEEMVAVRKNTEAKEEELNRQLKAVEEAKKRGVTSRETALRIMTLLQAKNDRDAAELLDEVSLDDLTPLERRLLEPPLRDLRQRTAEAAYKSGRSLLSASREEAAVKEFTRSVKADPTGEYAEKARYMLATTLYSLKRYDQAVPVLTALRKESKDKTLVDEVRYLLGISLAKSGKADEARSVLEEASRSGRYQQHARTYLASLETDGAEADKKRKLTQ